MPLSVPSAGSSGGVFNVTDAVYGADPTGVADSTAAIQAAVSAAITAGGGVVYLPGGTYLLSKSGVNSIVLPAGEHGQVTLRGAGKFATTIKLTTNTRSFVLVDQATSGLGTIYKNLTIEDLTVDNNNVTASSSRFGVIFGVGLRTSLENITIRRVDTINLGNATLGRRSVDMIVVANQRDPADTYTVKNILIEDCSFGRTGGGGATGVTCSSYEGGATPGNAQLLSTYRTYVYFDNIAYRRCSWRGGSPVNAFVSQVGFIAGGFGYGDRLRIEDCYAQDSGDDSFEIGSFYDVEIRNCVSQDAWSEHFYFRNMGGLLESAKQKVRMIGCRAICTYRSSFGVFIHSTDGIPLGHFSVKDCHFMTDGSPQSTAAVPVIPTAITARGAVRSLTIEDCEMVVRNFTRTWTANSQNFTCAAVDVWQEGRRGKLTIRNLGIDIEGTSDNTGGYSSIQTQQFGLRLDGFSDLELNVDGVQMRNLLKKVGAAHFVQAFMVNLGSGNVTGTQDTFATDRLSQDYVLDAGTQSDLAVTGGVLTSAANHGVEKRLRYYGNASSLYVSSYGPTTDQAAWAGFTYSQTAGHKGGVILKASDANNYLDAYLTDDGTNSILNLDKVVAGVRTNIATTTLGARLADAASYWVRAKAQGDVITVDHFTAAPSTTSVSASGVETITATLAGTDVGALGSLKQGYIGLAWVPAASSATVDNLTHVPMGVLHGTVKRLVPTEIDASQSAATGVTWNADNTKLRITELVFEDCDYRGGAGPGISEYASLTSTTTGHGQVVTRVRNTYSTVPAAAAVTVTASPFVFTNTDGLHEDVSVYGGTVSSITVTRKNGAASQVASATGQIVRLAPGDAITVTYSATPTMRKTPVS